MNEIREKFLPVGTVVMLKGGSKRVMITGFCSASQEEPDKVWDYTGCPYPEGYISSNQTCLFDHLQIEKIYHLGLAEDEEEKEFKLKMNELLESLQGMNNVKNANTSSAESLETSVEMLD